MLLYSHSSLKKKQPTGLIWIVEGPGRGWSEKPDSACYSAPLIGWAYYCCWLYSCMVSHIIQCTFPSPHWANAWGWEAGKEVDRYQPEALTYLASDFSSQHTSLKSKALIWKKLTSLKERINMRVLVGQNSDGSSGEHKAERRQDMMWERFPTTKNGDESWNSRK